MAIALDLCWQMLPFTNPYNVSLSVINGVGGFWWPILVRYIHSAVPCWHFTKKFPSSPSVVLTRKYLIVVHFMYMVPFMVGCFVGGNSGLLVVIWGVGTPLVWFHTLVMRGGQYIFACVVPCHWYDTILLPLGLWQHSLEAVPLFFVYWVILSYSDAVLLSITSIVGLYVRA